MDKVAAERDEAAIALEATAAPSFLQSDWWFAVKAAGGWRPFRFDAGCVPDTLANSSQDSPAPGDPNVAPGGLIRRIGPMSLAYIPFGFPGRCDPVIVADAVRRVCSAAPERPVLARWDVPFPVARFDEKGFRGVGFRPSPSRVQPPDTVIIDLRLSEDELLGRMKSKTRYNIRLAAKRGVIVDLYRPSDVAAADAFVAWYRLYEQTAERDRITIHSQDYYRRVFFGDGVAGVDQPDRSLLLARHDNDLLGGIITLRFAGTTTYLYGASAEIKRNLMAPYLLQWEAIRAARAVDDHWYDLFGVPPNADQAHPMHGLYRFKSGFGGVFVHRAGAWDLPIRAGGALALRSAERARAWYHYSFRKRGA